MLFPRNVKGDWGGGGECFTRLPLFMHWQVWKGLSESHSPEDGEPANHTFPGHRNEFAFKKKKSYSNSVASHDVFFQEGTWC